MRMFSASFDEESYNLATAPAATKQDWVISSKSKPEWNHSIKSYPDTQETKERHPDVARWIEKSSNRLGPPPDDLEVALIKTRR